MRILQIPGIILVTALLAGVNSHCHANTNKSSSHNRTDLRAFTTPNNLISNGDFLKNAAAYRIFPGYSESPNPASPAGWVVNTPTNAGVNGPGTGFYATRGAPFAPAHVTTVRNFAFMQGGMMVQAVATTAGQSYRLSYDAAGRADETNTDALEVIITDQTNHARICLQHPKASKNAFHRFTLNFTARSGLTAVAFVDRAGTVDVAHVVLVAIHNLPKPKLPAMWPQAPQTALSNNRVVIAGPDTWGAVDALGRVLPDFRQVGPPELNKNVGIFYFLWNNNPKPYVYNNDRIIRQRGYRQGWYLIGPMFSTHWWGQPLFGYYCSSDPWVLKEHAIMLGDAGVNTLIFDNTNGPIYLGVQKALFKVFKHMRALGNTVPNFCCYAGEGAWNKDYQDIYRAGLAKNLWYYWNGKPLMLIMNNQTIKGLPPKICKFFTLRQCGYQDYPDGKVNRFFGNGHNKWFWNQFYPQHYGWHTNPKTPEETSVGAAGWTVHNDGRDYHDGYEPIRKYQNPALGLCFAEQWRGALRIDPAFVFVTSWNEWTATVWPDHVPNNRERSRMMFHRLKYGQPMEVDGFDEEYSRDIEPMRHGFGDDYYYQLVADIRCYKGVHPLPRVSRTSAPYTGPFSQWANIGPLFINNVGMAIHRDYRGWGTHVYVNNTGRNDIVASKFCYDRKNLYFWVKTRKTMTPWFGRSWMLLFLNTTGNPHTGWLGYNYVIDRQVLSDNTSQIERNIHGFYQWKPVGKAHFRVRGDQMQMTIPRNLVGLKNHIPAEIHFKWADHIEQNGSWTDFYLNGDCAPPFRFYYRAKIRN